MSSNQQQMPRDQIINQLMKMLDHICQNAGYLRYIQNEQVLVDTKIYFDICQIIFSQLSIKLIKIQQYQGLDQGQKLDCLINLITNQLSINMPGLSGKQIIKFNISHIYQFLSLLLQYSKLYFERGSGAIQPSVKTQPHEVADDLDNRDRNPFSARPPGIVQYSPRSSQQRQHNYFKQNSKNHRNIYQKNGNFQKTKANPNQQNSDKLQHYPEKKGKKSGKLFDQVVKVVIQEKNRANKSSLRDQRKNKNVDIQQAKYKYQQYIKSYTKDKKAQNQRKSIKKIKQQQKQSKQNNIRQLPLKDFQNIDNFFKSFNYKLRDLKDVYVRRIQKQVRQKQREMTNFKCRKQRQTKKILQKLIQIQVDCLNNQHQIRKSQIQQECIKLQQRIKIDQRQLKRKTSTQKKQQKSRKTNDLENIQNLIRQQNEKVLMQLQQGGRLQRLIMSAYQKF